MRVCRNHGLPFTGQTYTFPTDYDGHRCEFKVSPLAFCSLSCVKTHLFFFEHPLLDLFSHFVWEKYHTDPKAVKILSDPGTLVHFRSDGLGVDLDRYLSGVFYHEEKDKTSKCLTDSVQLVEINFDQKGVDPADYKVLDLTPFREGTHGAEEAGEADLENVDLEAVDLEPEPNNLDLVGDEDMDD